MQVYFFFNSSIRNFSFLISEIKEIKERQNKVSSFKNNELNNVTVLQIQNVDYDLSMHIIEDFNIYTTIIYIPLINCRYQ